MSIEKLDLATAAPGVYRVARDRSTTTDLIHVREGAPARLMRIRRAGGGPSITLGSEGTWCDLISVTSYTIVTDEETGSIVLADPVDGTVIAGERAHRYEWNPGPESPDFHWTLSGVGAVIDGPHEPENEEIFELPGWAG
ncbi:hypothetical protein [Pseudactinotalea sp. Z1748]|uniref:hypothetical protein n=1 Tax=Pseudactinotalea sp. Z1748 TaxID=3413027 RepID=UPI003C7E2748